MVELILYKYTGLPNVINKTLDSTTALTLTGVIHNNIGSMRVQIELESVGENYNYCYISEFNKYYFIESRDILRTNVQLITLYTDVLKTYSTQILNSTGLITAADNTNLPYISTYNTAHNMLPQVSIIKYPYKPLSEDGVIIITTLKG